MYLSILKRWPKVDIEQKRIKWASISCPFSQPNLSNSEASDRVQSKRPIETLGSLDYLF